MREDVRGDAATEAQTELTQLYKAATGGRGGDIAGSHRSVVNQPRRSDPRCNQRAACAK